MEHAQDMRPLEYPYYSEEPVTESDWHYLAGAYLRTVLGPLGEYLPRHLRGYRREGDELLPLAGADRLVSQVLGVELRVEERLLRLVDATTGELLLTYEELDHRRREAEESLREAEESRRVAEESRRDAEQALRRERERVAELERRLREP